MKASIASFIAKSLALTHLLLISYAIQASTTDHDASVSSNKIVYNKLNDKLEINVTDISLKYLLTKLANESNLEVLFDDKAEENVSILLHSSNLLHGIKNILKGRNYSLHYDKNKQKQAVLTGLMVLPKNAINSKNARRLISLERQGVKNALKDMTMEQVGQINAAKERWQSRLDRLTPERRQALETRINNRVMSKAKHETRVQEKQDKFKQHQAKSQNYSSKHREASLQHLTPDDRLALEQSGAQAREQMKTQLLQLQNN